MIWVYYIITAVTVAIGALIYLWSLTIVFPELQQFDGLQSRWKLLSKARRDQKLETRVILISLALLMGALWITSMASSIASTAKWHVLFFPCFTPLAMIVPDVMYRSRIRVQIRRELADQGQRICLACGYNLTGNSSGTCPECGTATLQRRSGG